MTFKTDGTSVDGLKYTLKLPNGDEIQSDTMPNFERCHKALMTLKAGDEVEGCTIVSKKAVVTNKKKPPVLQTGRMGVRQTNSDDDDIERDISCTVQQRPSQYRNAPMWSWSAPISGKGKFKEPPANARSSYLRSMGSALGNPGPGAYLAHEPGFNPIGSERLLKRSASYAWSKRDEQRFPVRRFSKYSHCSMPNLRSSAEQNPGPAKYFGGKPESMLKGSPSWGSLAFRTAIVTRTADKLEGNKRNTAFVRKHCQGLPMYVQDNSWTPSPDAYKKEVETCMKTIQSDKHRDSAKWRFGTEKRPDGKSGQPDALILKTGTDQMVGPGQYQAPTGLVTAKVNRPTKAPNFKLVIND